MPGILSIVATPIGNLDDISARAIRTLKEAYRIGCEDTRVTGKLLHAYGIHTARVSLHQHSSDARLRSFLQEAERGSRIAYVSDAGTPGVNDPGGRLVEMAYELNIPLEVIPGPSALTAAISICGFPMERFTYVGFLPQKKRRSAMIAAMGARDDATVFFESTHRIHKTLEDLANVLGERTLYVGRELTKLHETHVRGTAKHALERLASSSSKGEFVIVVSPKP
ncbi:16S rRNA (cytidine(1402)-2'-O)-methyltransferase [Patescibacteria group bacterium]|uniref:Ribosomal RNA small subunit methyltransferase I n=1 Tax=candidate division WWE3 bacterium TaxID=2053526 RepID=A0A928TXS5_UNCKA|nr:16S rRNA (cytidine(1402)-2'-O)-methyltransferase [candidate division WWE3 bacterium]MCL4732285.1 16S rRNA (cytidine(1402)-2'-O)-methyltransferase [Patescibacteria group bacterium]